MTTSYLESFSSFFFVLLVMVVFISFYAFVFSPSLFTSFNIPSLPPQPSDRLPFAIGKSENGCDIFSGRWIRDEESRPLYEESECPYLLPQQTCLARGRPDKDYLYWKWQPNGCSVPSFNASLMLEALRGKRMMFAGDSLSRGHFHSMVCLLQKFIPDNAKSIKDVGQRAIFTAKEYNVTVEFYWAPYLLESNADDPKKHSVPGMARRGSINVHGQHWRGVDILVLHTYMWWFVDDYFKILEGSFQDEVKYTIDMPSDDAYRIGLESMLKWVEENMDPTKTRVFFTSASPNHKRNELWGGDQKGNCYNETILVEDPNYDVPKWLNKKIRIIDEVLSSKSNVQITLLNITRLSYYRKEAHTSIYKKQWMPLTAEQLANPMSYADCIHWCLPGVQDTWSELLFTKLFYP